MTSRDSDTSFPVSSLSDEVILTGLNDQRRNSGLGCKAWSKRTRLETDLQPRRYKLLRIDKASRMIYTQRRLHKQTFLSEQEKVDMFKWIVWKPSDLKPCPIIGFPPNPSVSQATKHAYLYINSSNVIDLKEFLLVFYSKKKQKRLLQVFRCHYVKSLSNMLLCFLNQKTRKERIIELTRNHSCSTECKRKQWDVTSALHEALITALSVLKSIRRNNKGRLRRQRRVQHGRNERLLNKLM